jgi:transposase
MKKRYFMGIDVAKATFDFCLLSSTGASLWRGRFDNEPLSIKRFLAQLRARGWKVSQIHFGLESSGVYGKRLIAAFHQAGLALSVLNPAQVNILLFRSCAGPRMIKSTPRSLPVFAGSENR